MPNRSAAAVLSVLLAAGWLAASAPAQHAEPDVRVEPMPASEGRPWIVHRVPNPNDPVEQAHQKFMKTQREMERELRKLRAEYFRGIRNTEIRQVGISKLAPYAEDPAAYPLLLEVFERDEDDVRFAILGLLAEQKSRQGDATLAWVAALDDEEKMRKEATRRLVDRVNEEGVVSGSIQSVVAEALRRSDDRIVAGGADLALALRLYDAIPMLINAQVAGGGGGDGGDGALAYILVGQQQAFVSDLTPVVGDSAVAFDPDISVVTEGTVVRIIDAVVVTYRTEVNTALRGLASAGWGGRSVDHLGWDGRAWREWYAREFVPYRRQVEAERAATEADEDAGAAGPG